MPDLRHAGCRDQTCPAGDLLLPSVPEVVLRNRKVCRPGQRSATWHKDQDRAGVDGRRSAAPACVAHAPADALLQLIQQRLVDVSWQEMRNVALVTRHFLHQ
ncbi:hypothetical protein LNP17_29845 [Klebsiella variicola subsp. variicola]|nr:hypothetical protein [Klebsiella variicola subsp. variicola]